VRVGESVTVTLGRDRVAIVAFHSEAWTVIGLTVDEAALDAAIDRIEPGPGTRMDRGLAEALAVLDASPRSGAAKLTACSVLGTPRLE